MLLGEPALDILHELYLADSAMLKHNEEKLAASSSLSAGAAKRWFAVLEREGFIVRADNDESQMARTVIISQKGKDALHNIYQMQTE